MSYSEEFEEDEEVQIDLQKFEKAEGKHFEDQIEIAECIYKKLRSYIEFRGLDLLDAPPHECISNLTTFTN